MLHCGCFCLSLEWLSCAAVFYWEISAVIFNITEVPHVFKELIFPHSHMKSLVDCRISGGVLRCVRILVSCVPLQFDRPLHTELYLCRYIYWGRRDDDFWGFPGALHIFYGTDSVSAFRTVIFNVLCVISVLRLSV